MIIEGRYLDEILRELYTELSQSTDKFKARKGSGQDLLGAKVVLKDPRARLSATAKRGVLTSALAEFCWYMSGSASLDFIRFYIEEYPPIEATGSLEEAYGPRFIGTGEFGHSFNQIERVIDQLRKRPDTRRAAISVLDPRDLQLGKNEAPCTIALQFIRRRERLHLVAMMRSNDAYLGFPHDVFCFTMIQEIIARALGIKVGEYHHFATSLHLYEYDRGKIADYLDEGFQSPTFAMPRMPAGCQLNNLKAFLSIEEAIRNGKITTADQIELPEYWYDLSLVLLRRADVKFGRGEKAIDKNLSNTKNHFYKNFFAKRPKILLTKTETMIQEKLDLGDESDSKK